MHRIIRVVVAEDNAVLRKLLCLQLDAADGIEIVAEAGDGIDALYRAQIFVPDVILLDLLMVRKPGIEAIPEIRATVPHTRILALHDVHEGKQEMDEELLFQALLAGAHGTAGKLAPMHALGQRVKEVYAGQWTLAPSTARRPMQQLSRPVHSLLKEEPLTDREVDVLALLARGIGVEEIARRLITSEQTIYDHIAALINKVQPRPRGNLPH